MRVLALPLVMSLCGLLFSIVAGPNSPLFGRVIAQVDDHTVVVWDCHTMRTPVVQELADTPAGEDVFRFAPCRNAEVVVEGDRLFVNGTLYGRLSPRSVVAVERHSVIVNGVERDPLPPPR